PLWHEGLAWPWVGAANAAQITFGEVPASQSYIFAIELIFGILGAVACAAAWLPERLPLSLTAYCTGIWLVATSQLLWRSVPRYELALFPLLILLADATRRRPRLRAAI